MNKGIIDTSQTKRSGVLTTHDDIGRACIASRGKNPLRISKVIAMRLVYYLFWDTMYIEQFGFLLLELRWRNFHLCS